MSNWNTEKELKAREKEMKVILFFKTVQKSTESLTIALDLMMYMSRLLGIDALAMTDFISYITENEKTVRPKVTEYAIIQVYAYNRKKTKVVKEVDYYASAVYNTLKDYEKSGRLTIDVSPKIPEEFKHVIDGLYEIVKEFRFDMNARRQNL